MSNVKSDENKWMREDDAMTLARAEEIKADKKRLRGAVSEAKKMARKRKTEAKNIEKIARTNIKNNSAGKPKTKKAAK
jgi:hypothetical protein